MPGPAPELKSYLVRAGAGTGKTTGLVNQVLDVYRAFKTQSGQEPRIVVTTFTRKATQELKERLIKRACDDRDPDFLRYVSEPAKLHISTIHGLLSLFLKQVGHLAGLDSGFSLLSEGEGRHLARRALRESMVLHPDGLQWFELYEFGRVLEMGREFDRKKREHGALTPATLEDIQNTARPIIEKGRGALNELAARILEENDNEDWVTFAQALKIFAGTWPATSIDEMPSKPDMRSKVQKALVTWHELAKETLEPFKKQFSKPAWNQANWPKMVELWTKFQSFGEEFSKQLNQMKESQGRFEMNDLELLTASLLKERPFLAEVFADNWDYWMVDEYQDTSPIQSACLRALIGDRKKYLVGDPQQSIYLFRGADVKVFSDAEKTMAAEGGDVRELMRNYRSKPDLLHFINGFMAELDPVFVPMETVEHKNSSRVVASILKAQDEAQEMEALAARVGELALLGVNLQDICILGRAHAHLKEAAVVLKKYGFPTHLHASTGFNDRREVLDAQALWMFLLNPHDTKNLITLLRSPWFFVRDSQLEAWMAHKPQSLWRYLVKQKDMTEEAVSRLEDAQDSVKLLGVVKTFEKLLVDARYLDLCLHNDPAGRKESNLWKMINKARELESESTRSLLDLSAQELILNVLESTEGDATSAQEPNCINLMTIHGAKGLEFEHVIIPRMGKSLRASSCADFSGLNGKYFFPLRDEETGENSPSVLDHLLLTEQQENESREYNRTLYVAATRAKSTLTFTYSFAEKNSWAQRHPWFALAPGVHQRDQFTFSVADQIPAPQNYAPLRDRTQDVRPKWMELQVQAGKPTQSVTGLLEGKKPVSAKSGGALVRFQARNKGQRIHRMLESLKYRGVNSLVGDPSVDFVVNLQDPPMKDLITNGFVEWGFQVKTKTRLIEGQIDAWGKSGGEIFVIDYKSGSPTQAEDAFKQLAAYSWALRKFGHTETIKMVVIYPLQKAVQKREFSEKLFLSLEREFSLAETAGQNDLGGPLLDGGHGNVKGDLVGSAETVHVGI